jgi:hypothetical protein
MSEIEAFNKCITQAYGVIARCFQRIMERLKPLWQIIQRAFLPRSRRVHNTRIQMVQAKRAQLMLPPSGKYAGMSRRESYALAREVLRTGVYE